LKTRHWLITALALVFTFSLASTLVSPALTVRATGTNATAPAGAAGTSAITGTVTDQLPVLWDSIAAEDYQQALELSIVQGQENPLYFELAFYFAIISFNSSNQRRQVNEELRYAIFNEETIEAFIQDLNEYLPEHNPLYKLVKAIIEFDEYQNTAQAIKLVEESLVERETVLGYYLQFSFTNNIESLRKAAALAERPAGLKVRLLIADYNEEWDRNREPDRAKYAAEFEKLLADDHYYFENQDYLMFLQMGLGKTWHNTIGPAGPNDEPFFGALCAVAAWDSFAKFAPRHRVLFALAVGGPGGQNTEDAEQLLSYIDDETLSTYAPLVKMLRIYESFHDYQYDEAYQLADELLAMDLDDPFYYMYLYDLAYEYEMFFFEGYYPDQTMIDKAVLLYDKAFRAAPPESRFWQEAALRDKGRSQYYAKQYEDSIATLTAALALREDPFCDIFICLDYYALKDYENGAIWEQRVRDAFAGNTSILAEFGHMLSKVKE